MGGARANWRNRFGHLGFTIPPAAAAELGFRDFYEAFLNKLCCSRHGIGVHLDPGNDVCVSPTMGLRRGTAEFDLPTALHEVCDEFFVWIASGNIAVRVIRLVVQGHVASI